MRVSDIDDSDAHGISAGPSYMSLELRRAGHARLVAPSLAIASGEATYTLRHHAADGVPHKFRTKIVVAPGTV